MTAITNHVLCDSGAWRSLTRRAPSPPLPKGLDALWSNASGLIHRLRSRSDGFLRDADLVQRRIEAHAELDSCAFSGAVGDIRVVFRLNREKADDVRTGIALASIAAQRALGLTPHREQIAAALAIARDVVASPLGATLVIALVDAEEEGLLGAKEFVAQPPIPLGQIVLNVNLDMVSRTAGLLWAVGAHHTPALRPVIEEATANAPVTVRQGHDRPGAPEGANWTNSSDHAPFHQAGIPFVYFGVEDHADYHRPTDDFENIDPVEYVASVRTILTVMRALDEALR